MVFGLSAELGSVNTVDGKTMVTAPASLGGGPEATLTPDAAIVLVGIQEGSPDYARALPLVVDYVSSVAVDGAGQHYVIAEPAVPLRPRAT